MTSDDAAVNGSSFRNKSSTDWNGQKLPDRQRAIFSPRHYEFLPLEEIAQILKLDVGIVKAHLFRVV